MLNDTYVVSHLPNSALVYEHVYRIKARTWHIMCNDAPTDIIKISTERAYKAWKEIERRAAITIMLGRFDNVVHYRVMG